MTGDRAVIARIGTAIMVTHSMAQALEVGDRTVTFHQGKVVFDVSGPERQSLNVPVLLGLFRQNQNEELSDDALYSDELPGADGPPFQRLAAWMKTASCLVGCLRLLIDPLRTSTPPTSRRALAAYRRHACRRRSSVEPADVCPDLRSA